MMLPSWAWAQLYAPPDGAVDLPVQVVQSAQNRTPEEIREWAFSDDFIWQYLNSSAYSANTFEAMWPDADPEIHVMIVEPPNYSGQIVLIDSTVDPEEAEELPVVDTGTFTEFARYAPENVAADISFVAGTFNRSGSEVIVVGVEHGVVAEHDGLVEPLGIRTFYSMDIVPREDLAHATAYSYAVLSSRSSPGSGGKTGLRVRTHPVMMNAPDVGEQGEDTCACHAVMRADFLKAKAARAQRVAEALQFLLRATLTSIAICIHTSILVVPCLLVAAAVVSAILYRTFQAIDSSYFAAMQGLLPAYHSCCSREECVCPDLPLAGPDGPE